jgi:hypothetical protein
MKISLTVLATMAVLASSVAARAGEGDGPDFPGLLQPHTTLANPVISDIGSETYPSVVGAQRNPVVVGSLLPSNGSDGIVQTENSLPKGFAKGTPSYEYAQSVQRYWARSEAAAASRVAGDTLRMGGERLR